MEALTALLLVGGGFVAGVVNTLAGGGSLLTVPLLVMVGLPGSLANGTNRVGVLAQCLVAAWGFRAQGIFEPRAVARVVVPVGIGAAIGALWVSQLADDVFERIFGLLMLVLLVPTLRRGGRNQSPNEAGWSPLASGAVFLCVGLYAGGFQAGVGIPLLFALLHTGWDAAHANAIKVAVIAVATAVAVPVFFSQDQIAWGPAGLLALGFSAGAALGARLAVRGGERVVRPVLALAVIALAARMLGVY